MMKRGTLIAATVAVAFMGGVCAWALSTERAPEQPHAVAANPVVDARTQFDLAQQLDAALDQEDVASAYASLVREWRGRQYRWRAFYSAALCPNATRCNVVPFDRARRDRGVVHGWMPRLVLKPSEYQKLAERCGVSAGCEFEFSGTMAELTVSVDQFTRLEFVDVSIGG